MATATTLVVSIPRINSLFSRPKSALSSSLKNTLSNVKISHSSNNNNNNNNNAYNSVTRVATSNAVSSTNPHNKDVVVKRAKNNNAWLIKSSSPSKWKWQDIRNLVIITTTHLLAMFAPFHFNWGAVRVCIGIGIVTGVLGICLSYHRNLTHKSFKLPKWLEYLFAYFGVLAMQEDPITWVSNHRRHHKFCDSELDPHTPVHGFWFSHMNWLFDTTMLRQKSGEASNVEDLERQVFYRFIRTTYWFHPYALGLLLYLFGGFSYLVWGLGARATIVYHFTFLVNSACHTWGNQAWNTGDLSRNNWWAAMLTAGEGWHNNHHAFEYSARHGLEWWQVDVTWYIIKLLEALGLAKDVKLPTEAHKQRLSFKPS